MSGVILQAKGLGKSYGAIKVLHDIDMTLHEGESRVVIGPNGAGKTTLFKCLSGETQGNAGTITLQGRDVTRDPGFRRVRAGVGRTFQVARVFPDMTVRENLTVAVEMRERIAGAGLRQLLSLAPRRAVAAEVSRLVDDFGIGHVADRPARITSHGDKKRLELGMSLALRPRLLMLDEPTQGVDVGARQRLFQALDAAARDGSAILIASTDPEQLAQLCHRVLVFSKGRIVSELTGARITKEAISHETLAIHPGVAVDHIKEAAE